MHDPRPVRLLLLLVALVVPLAGRAAEENPVSPAIPPEVREVFDRPLVLDVPGTSAVEVRQGLVYRRDGDDELPLDVYLPPDLEPGKRRAAVVFVHGGPMPRAWSWPVRQAGFFRSHGRTIAARGFVGVVLSHRYPSLAEIELSDADLQAALAYVREHAGELSVDPERLALWVFSGGGLHLARPLREPVPGVRSLVGYYPVVEPSAFGELARGEMPDALAERFRPAAQLEADWERPPLLLTRAGLDSPAFNEALDAFVDAALNSGLTLDLFTHPAGVHGFDTQTDDERSRDILRATYAFLDRHLTGD